MSPTYAASLICPRGIVAGIKVDDGNGGKAKEVGA